MNELKVFSSSEFGELGIMLIAVHLRTNRAVEKLYRPF